MLRRGMSLPQIAAALGHSLAAVEAHATALAEALGVQTSELPSALGSIQPFDLEQEAGIDIEHFRTAFGLEPAR